METLAKVVRKIGKQAVPFAGILTGCVYTTRMPFLFLFLDGVGLGSNDPATNPLAAAEMPVLQSLLNGRKLLLDSAPWVGPQATLLALDARLGVPGFPQSATGQAVLLTGRNVPAEIGSHYGPKPNEAIAAILQNGNLFHRLHSAGRTAALLNAYPDGYFQAILSGRRMYSAIPLAVTSGGFPLKTQAEFFAGAALAADFTGQGWRDHLGFEDAPITDPHTAGRHLAGMAASYDFAFFEFWVSDYLGHHQDMSGSLEMLATFDGVLGGLLEAWDHETGLVLLTSDHGNLEDLSTKRHTMNPVPGLVIGAPALRREFTRGLHDLTGVAPAVCSFLGI